MFTLYNSLTRSIDPFTPARGAEGIQKGGKLVEGIGLSVQSNLEGAKVTIS